MPAEAWRTDAWSTKSKEKPKDLPAFAYNPRVWLHLLNNDEVDAPTRRLAHARTITALAVAAVLLALRCKLSAPVCFSEGPAVNATTTAGNEAGAETELMCFDWRSYLTLWLTFASLCAMAAMNAPPDLVLLGVTCVLLLLRVISDQQAWQGLSSPSILTIAALFVVAKGVEVTRAVEPAVSRVLGAPRSHGVAVLRLSGLTMLLSAFLNNTPVVAMLAPVTADWAARHGLSRRVLLMPLSFSSMLGGMCTLVGTARRS